jgi:hypothetical protein
MLLRPIGKSTPISIDPLVSFSTLAQFEAPSQELPRQTPRKRPLTPGRI